MPPKSKKNIDTLTRVRNNQRRCRARKREHVAELEKKVQELEDSRARSNCDEARIAMQRLEDENKKLRELLTLAGFGETWVEAHLKSPGGSAGSQQSGVGQDVSHAQGEIENFEEIVPEAMTTVALPDTYRTGFSPTVDDLFNVPFQLSGGEFGFFLPSLFPPSIDPPSTLKANDKATRESSCCSNEVAVQQSYTLSSHNPTGSDCGRINSEFKNDAILCSVAFELVRQHNKRGLDMIEIGIRLWNGFMKGDPDGGGCKVDTKLLNSVLEDISI